jgi:hypothetical protein
MASTSAAPQAVSPRARTATAITPLLPVCACLLIGVAFGPRHSGSWQIILVLAIVATVLAVFARTSGAWTGVAMLLALGLGLWRAAPAQSHLVQWPHGRVDAVRGTVAAWPISRGEMVRTTIRITGARTEHGWESANALVQALLPAYPVAGHGDSIVVGGSPSLLPARTADVDGSLYGQWLRIERADQVQNADRLRHTLQSRLIDGIEKNIREPEAGFAVGVLLGVHSTVDDATLAALNATGTTQHCIIPQNERPDAPPALDKH